MVILTHHDVFRAAFKGTEMIELIRRKLMVKYAKEMVEFDKATKSEKNFMMKAVMDTSGRAARLELEGGHIDDLCFTWYDSI